MTIVITITAVNSSQHDQRQFISPGKQGGGQGAGCSGLESVMGLGSNPSSVL